MQRSLDVLRLGDLVFADVKGIKGYTVDGKLTVVSYLVIDGIPHGEGAAGDEHETGRNSGSD